MYNNNNNDLTIWLYHCLGGARDDALRPPSVLFHINNIIIILPTPTAQQQTQSLHRPSICTVCTHQDSSKCKASKRVVKMIINAASVYRMMSTATHQSSLETTRNTNKLQGFMVNRVEVWVFPSGFV